MAKVVQLRNIKRALRLEPNASTSYLIGGRVSNFRTYRSFNFIDLIDGSTSQHLQVVVKKELLKKPELGSYLVCQGNLSPSPGAQQSVEFKVNRVELASRCDADKWPLSSARSRICLTDGWYRRHLHLRPQASHFASLLRVRSELELSLHLIFKQMDFFKVHTPLISSNDSEASGDLFTIHRSKLTNKAHNREAPGSGYDSEEEQDEQLARDEQQEQHRQQPRDAQMEPSTEKAATAATAAAAATTTTNTGSMGRSLKRDYFDKDVYLVSSAQLHLESLSASLSRVYCLSAAFRAENSLSRRHLCEFTMLEAEEANLVRLEPLMDRVETIVKFSAQFISDISEFRQDFRTLLDKYSSHETYEKMACSPYIRMTYEEAMKVLRSLHSSPTSGTLLSDLPLSACHYGNDISRRHERHLLSYCNNVPLFITNYPKQLKPFYMKCNEKGDEALCFDLIAPFGGEICGGSLREDDLEALRETLRRRQRPSLSDRFEEGQDNNQIRTQDELNRNFQWYLELREFGTFPHGGFGIGFERLIQSLLGIPNIKDTIAYPRWAGSCAM